MNKIYQPIVIERSNEIVQSLVESGFFNEYELPNTDFAKEYLCEKLTEKFIENGSDINEAIFTENEFENILRVIITGSVLGELKRKGYIGSYEDDETEETFFLTEEGKEMLKNLKNIDGEIKE
jgi:predicted transcriptional regulator